MHKFWVIPEGVILISERLVVYRSVFPGKFSNEFKNAKWWSDSKFPVFKDYSLFIIFKFVVLIHV